MNTSKEWLVVSICCLSLFLVSMDITIVNVAMPTIGADLRTGVSGLQWTIDAYTLALTSFLILAGSTADRVGRRRTFQFGLALFSAGSVLCGLAPSIEWLIVFRVVQGLGGAMLNPVALSIITNTVTDPQRRARAIGIWGAVVGVSMALGPILGGVLTQTVGWRSVFWINAPIGVLAIVLAAWFVPESKADHARRLDPVGQILVVAGLASLIFGLIEAPAQGWGSALTIGMFILSAAAFVGLVFYESRRREPLLDLRFFKSVPFTTAAVSAVCAFTSFSSFLFLNSLYLQNVLKLSAFTSGLALLPAAAMTAMCSPISAHLVAKVGTRLPFVIAGASTMAAAALLMLVGASGPFEVLLAAFVLFGIGLGFVNSPITNTAVSGMPRARAGSAAAVTSTSRQLGTSLGVAIAGTLVASIDSSDRTRQILEGSHIMWWMVLVCGGVLIALGIAANTAWAKRSTDRIAHLLD